MNLQNFYQFQILPVYVSSLPNKTVKKLEGTRKWLVISPYLLWMYLAKPFCGGGDFEQSMLNFWWMISQDEEDATARTVKVFCP